ncbi:hypothetical protein V8Z74_15955 [Comamonas sp. w2-DMI]|uniref:hypothetical protein n=1 Tax=Comamonas sp. w2-DMI TaxID=3126391 RepID=UPI0032E4A2E8
MTRNPEFQRQLWLNWSPSLLAWSLGLSALVLALPLVLAPASERASYLGVTATAGLWMASAVYGSVLAGRSLAEEAGQNTWDWQRLSALSPWQMAWGKLLGSAVPAWMYTLWFALAVLFVSATWAGQAALGLHSVALAVLWGLGLQAWAMNSVLIGWGQREIPANRRRAALLPLLFLFFIPGPYLGRIYGSLLNGSERAVLWWGLDIGSKGMAYLFGALLLALGLLTLWRQLCARLDVRTLPWAWPLGLAASGFFVAGTLDAGLPALWKATAWIALAATAYAALQHVHSDLRSWRQVQWSASRGRWREMLQALPLWPVSWLLALAASLLLPLQPNAHEAGHGAGMVALLACLQLLRDGLILTGFALLAGRLRSPLAAFCMAWVVINIVLPLLALGLAGPGGAAAVQPAMALMFGDSGIPAIRDATAWVSLGLQLLLAAGWAAWIFRDRVLGFAHENG